MNLMPALICPKKAWEWLLALVFLACPLTGFAGQNAAPSSHLVFDDNFDGHIIINEVRVPKEGEAKYTYYETLGWRGRAAGYAGLQAHPRGHNYIFSIWDHKSHAAPIRAVYRGAGTITEKFGGEGTGLKSWNFELGWETDTWYTLALRYWPLAGHSFYGYWVRSGKTGKWTHLVTMDVAAKAAFFQGGTDAFIEDWLETGVKPRTVHYRGGWKRKVDGGWHPFASGRYSVNSWDLEKGKRSFNFRTNWNAGVSRDQKGAFYFMSAGGQNTVSTTKNPSRHELKRAEGKPGYVPIKIRSAGLSVAEGGKLRIHWENDPATLPQFSFTVTLSDKRSKQGDSLVKVTKVEPHARKVEIPLPAGMNLKKMAVRLQCRDILDNQSELLPVYPAE
jgi:hypothetical protein